MSDTRTVAPFGSPPTVAELTALRAWRQHGSIPAAARALGRSPHTVNEQLRNIRSRVGVSRTWEACVKLLDVA